VYSEKPLMLDWGKVQNM